MPLNIRDPRATKLARELADRQGTTMTAVIVDLLQREAQRQRAETSLEQRIAKLVEKLKRNAGPNQRKMNKNDIDDLWTAK